MSPTEVTARLESAEAALSRGAALQAQAGLLPLAELPEAQGYRLFRLLASAAQALGGLPEADRWLERAGPFAAADAQVQADWTLARFANALARSDAGRAAALGAELDRALGALPHLPRAAFLGRRAQVLASHGRSAQALECFAQAMAAAAAGGDAGLEAAAAEGAAQLHAGNRAWAEAERCLRAALEKVSGAAAVSLWLSLGDVKFEQGDPKEAQACYLRAEADGGARAWTRLAALHARQGQLDEAERRYQQAIAAVPSDDPAVGALLDELAGVYGQLNRFDDARAALQQAIANVERARPGDVLLEAHLRLRLGGLLLSQGEASSAAVELQLAAARLASEAGDRHPALAGVLNTLALAQLRAGDARAAEVTAKRSLAIAVGDSASALALNTLGMVELAKGSAAGARAHWEKSKGLFEQAGFGDEARGVQKNLASLP